MVFQYIACIYCLFTQLSTKNLNILGEAQPFKVDKVPVTGLFMVLTSGIFLVSRFLLLLIFTCPVSFLEEQKS